MVWCFLRAFCRGWHHRREEQRGAGCEGGGIQQQGHAKLTECGDHELDADCADGEKGYLGAGAYDDKYVMSGKIVKCGY